MDSLHPLRFLRASAAQWGPRGSPPPGAQGRAHSSWTGGQIQRLHVAPWAGGVGSISFEGLEPTGGGGLAAGVAPQTMVHGVGGTVPGWHTGVPTRLGMGSWGGRKGQHTVGGCLWPGCTAFLVPTAHPDRSGSDKCGWGPTGLCSVALDAEGALVTCPPPPPAWDKEPLSGPTSAPPPPWQAQPTSGPVGGSRRPVPDGQGLGSPRGHCRSLGPGAGKPCFYPAPQVVQWLELLPLGQPPTQCQERQVAAPATQSRAPR